MSIFAYVSVLTALHTHALISSSFLCMQIYAIFLCFFFISYSKFRAVVIVTYFHLKKCHFPTHSTFLLLHFEPHYIKKIILFFCVKWCRSFMTECKINSNKWLGTTSLTMNLSGVNVEVLAGCLSLQYSCCF